ncbi:L-tyrosine/L-tryptophan isonitrile synthase family protein [Chryseobacterium nematophagum]|nr:isocyanide synthase family protein [Chryseobacterium nematophagum]
MLNKKIRHNTCSIHEKLVRDIAYDILATVMQFRITKEDESIYCNIPCNSCYEPHISKIVNSIEKSEPILFVLPAFPGKSPNPQKVLGPLPDMAERYSLQFLNDLCKSIQKIYSPGARILICSDGRVFSNVIGMKDSDITSYQKELDSIIKKLELTYISTFHLDQLYGGDDFESMRHDLMESFGKPISLLKEKVSRGINEYGSREDKEANRMYRSITKFLFEDSLYPGQPKSRTEIQKDAKKRAYNVIQLSNAWSDFIAQNFPEHVRLSIHPQTCGDVKIGIKLSNESSITPWHGVALNINGKIMFVKRFEAEKLKAQLVYNENAQPDYYIL